MIDGESIVFEELFGGEVGFRDVEFCGRGPRLWAEGGEEGFLIEEGSNIKP